MECKRYLINEKTGAYLDRFCHTDYPESMPNTRIRPAVLVCPGGGYVSCCPREGDIVAYQFLAADYHTFVLNYTIGDEAVFPASLLDLCAAMKLIRENAKEWGVLEDQIAICGFSAGGHLCASLGVYWNEPEIMKKSGCLNGENKPNAMMLIYPVISTSWMENHDQLSRIIGSNDWDSTYKKLNLHTAVSKDTPQTFLCHTFRDQGVPVKDSLKFATALVDADVPCELHIFPNGGHGMSLGTPQAAGEAGADESFAQWSTLAIRWLNRLFANPDEANKPVTKAKYSSKY